MRKFILIVISSFIFTSLTAQKDTELGLFSGISYYNGDVNPSKLFYSPKLAYGGLIKYNLDKHYSIKLAVTKAKISGSDLDFDNVYQQTRQYQFTSSLTNISFNLEFNFLPFAPAQKNEFFTTFISSGFSFLILSQKNLPGYNFAVPFGGGIKYAPNKKLTFALEWTLNKSFTDMLDGLEQAVFDTTINPIPVKQRSDLSSKDWYSFAGISITYKFAGAKHSCPAYGR